MIKTCLTCTNSFSKKPTVSLSKWSITKFCSFGCYWKDKIGKPSWNKDKTLSDMHKKNLSESHTGLPSHWKGKKRPENSGEKNNMWKGGITPINAKIRTSLEYKLWRVAVFERDNYTCVWCGQVGGDLQVDHIKPFAYFPELRFAIDNGRVLCIKCHKTTDTFAGKGLKRSLNTNA